MINILNDEEIQKIFTAAHGRGNRDYTMIFLAISTGLRCSELIGLYIEDIAPYGDVSTILIVPSRIGKNSKRRQIPINDDVRFTISRYINYKHITGEPTDSNSYLFVSRYSNNPLSSRDFQRIVHDISISSIGRSVTPHTLRHTFATRLLNHTNIRVIQELLGHANLQTTQIYTHPNISDKQLAIENSKLPGTIIL